MSDTFDELSARSRRGELARAEQQRLDVFLKASVEARLWHHAGRELDAEDAVLPGDHAAVERVMQRALSALPASRPRRRARAGVLLAAGALLIASVAAASVEGVRYWREHAKALAVAANPPRPVNESLKNVSASAPIVTAAPSVAEPTADTADTLTAPVPTTAAPLRAKGKLQATSAAAELFGAAALARREGNSGKAIALLDSLQERFPGSPEARLGDMTLGALHLQRGASASALEHFRRYLHASPQGELASEAVWGEFQALSALGQRTEAQRRLQVLVERYPGSAYASAARAKLKAESASP